MIHDDPFLNAQKVGQENKAKRFALVIMLLKGCQEMAHRSACTDKRSDLAAGGGAGSERAEPPNHNIVIFKVDLNVNVG
jgi:hypothetical protein